MGSLPDWRETRTLRLGGSSLGGLSLAGLSLGYSSLGAVVYAWPLPIPALRPVSVTNRSQTTCFCGRRKSSMFVEMPLDNRTVNEFAALAATSGFFRPLETSAATIRLNISSRLIVL
jgi:hypothetical protein